VPRRSIDTIWSQPAVAATTPLPPYVPPESTEPAPDGPGVTWVAIGGFLFVALIIGGTVGGFLRELYRRSR
jgi:hypothetical protein